ncbi:MAG: leucine-rich repeat domain-containing protein [Dehalococcoidia bacterium]|nr:MAG: leucine-rich repeat domain-containing protein [Dehalococcoidia bacterium]
MSNKNDWLDGIKKQIDLLRDTLSERDYKKYKIRLLLCLAERVTQFYHECGQCQIFQQDISALSPLTNLTELRLIGNKISDLSSLAPLTNLTGLELCRNQISDIYPLIENSGLDAGDWVCLEDNNLDLGESSENMENVRILEQRGVRVYY